MEISGALRNECNSLFLEAKLSRSAPGVCELYSACKRKCIASVTYEAILSHFFVTFDDITKIVTFEDVSDLHRLHLCACPICSWSDFQRVRFSTDVLRDALDILTPSLWNYKFISKFEWRRFKNQNLQIKTLSYYFFARWSVANASPSHQTNGQAGFMYTFLCCVVYSLVLYTLSLLCDTSVVSCTLFMLCGV